MVHRRLVYIYLLNVLSFSRRYFNKIERTSRSGRLLALSLEILSLIACNAKITIHNLIACPETLPIGLKGSVSIK